jgi:hypothetical protein
MQWYDNYCDNHQFTLVSTGNTIAPGLGNSKCYDCPANYPLASSLHTICMPADTPKDAISYRAQLAIDITQIPYRHTNYAVELDYFGLPEFTGMLAVFYFFNYSHVATPYTLYASTKTGNPSEQNHEYKMYGVNATIGVERTEDAVTTGLFLTVEAPKDKMEIVAVQLLSPFKMIQVKPPGTQFKLPRDTLAYSFFEVSNIDQRSKVTITVSIIDEHSFKADIVIYN